MNTTGIRRGRPSRNGECLKTMCLTTRITFTVTMGDTVRQFCERHNLPLAELCRRALLFYFASYDRIQTELAAQPLGAVPVSVQSRNGRAPWYRKWFWREGRA